MKGVYKIADKIIEITSLYPDVHEYCKEYAVAPAPGPDTPAVVPAPGPDIPTDNPADTPADIRIETTLSDIEFEREKSLAADKAANRPVYEFSKGYLEELAVYRKIAEKMPAFDTFLFHASAIAVDGEGYIFTAKSGTGKSTHTRLWREYLGEKATMINDDKPLIHVTDEQATVYGTPYNGKHRIGTNTSVKVKAICILTRADENVISPITMSEAYPMLLQQSYRPMNPEMMSKTLHLIDKMAETVKFYKLGCNMDISAAEVAYTGML